jgi:arylformamidase
VCGLAAQQNGETLDGTETVSQFRHGSEMRLELSRRQFVGISSGAAAGFLLGCRPDETETPRSPLIFREYDEAALDAAYDPAAWADNIDEVVVQLRARNASAITALGAPARHAYGSSDIEALDWYSPAEEEGAPIHVHFYGGGWRTGAANISTFIAELSVAAGAHCVLPDYVNVGDTGGDLLPLGEQCRRAVAWVYSNAQQFGANPEKIIVSGHSAGGHLAGVVLTTDWTEYGLPTDVVKAGLCVSGWFELYPVSLSSKNDYVSFTDDSIALLSPQRHVHHITAEVIVAVGTGEGPEFERQSRDFHAALAAAGKNSRLLIGDGLNHYEIVLDMGTSGGVVGRALTELINTV